MQNDDSKTERLAGLDEARKAAKRIGESDEDVLRWALRVAQEDLTTLSAGDIENLRHEIALVVWLPPLPSGNPPRGLKRNWDFSTNRTSYLFRIAMCEPPWLKEGRPLPVIGLPGSMDTITAIHAAMREQFYQIGRASCRERV